jgi:hypothetical protein
VDVRRGVLELAGEPRICEWITLGHGSALADAKRPEVGERGLVAVVGHDRDGETVRRHRTGERDLTRDWSTDRARVPERDVDAAMLARGVLVVPDRELAQHGSVRGPGPAESTGGAHRRSPAEDDEKAERQSRCHSSEHGATVAGERCGRNAL